MARLVIMAQLSRMQYNKDLSTLQLTVGKQLELGMCQLRLDIGCAMCGGAYSQA